MGEKYSDTREMVWTPGILVLVDGVEGIVMDYRLSDFKIGVYIDGAVEYFPDPGVPWFTEAPNIVPLENP